MSNKILSITLAQPKEATLPDGIYVGKYGGYRISLACDDKYHMLKTEKCAKHTYVHTSEGIRGIAVPVVVTIKSGIATFEIINN